MKSSALCLPKSEMHELLEGNLSPGNITVAEEHLADCETCRTVIESMIANSRWWDDARSSLAAGAHLPGDLRDHAPEAERETTEQLLALLGPTDDPAMLGRIGTYEIVGLLGRGGMGVVFKGYDAALSRFVAIKMLLPHLAASGAARKRFAREARAAAAVVDDHVMAIHGVSEWNSVPYFVMPYARGVSLQKRLDTDGPLEVREILRVGMQAAKGLAAAHAQGLVHRDVKPANIFLDKGVERVQLMDFGLARAVDDASLTRSGTLAGTPLYMSPEQARGESVDHRSDLFSLGSVLYTMCTGHAPFRAETSYGVLRRITDDTPRQIREINSDIPEWLESLVVKLLAKSADDRFESAEQVAELLEDCLAHVQQPTAAPLPKTLQQLSTYDGLPRPSKQVTNANREKQAEPRGILPKLNPAAAAGILLSIAAVGLLLMAAMWMTDPPDISGSWYSEEWGWVELTQTEPGKYEGTIDRVILKGDAWSMFRQFPNDGKFHLKWSPIEQRFNGQWREGLDYFGKLSLRQRKEELTGGWTSGSDSKRDKKHPRLGDLRLTRYNYENRYTTATGKKLVGLWKAEDTILWLQIEKDGTWKSINHDQKQPQRFGGTWTVEDNRLLRVLNGGDNPTGELTLHNIQWLGPDRVAFRSRDGHKEVLAKIPGNALPQTVEEPGQESPRVGPGSAKQEGSPPATTGDGLPTVDEPTDLLDCRTIEEMTASYNKETRNLRAELFEDSIPDLTVKQMGEVMLDAAKTYRQHTNYRSVAVALEQSAKSGRLVDKLDFVGMGGGQGADLRQIAPMLHYHTSESHLRLVVLPKAELRFRRKGPSSTNWGDIRMPGLFDGQWELESIKESGSEFTESAVAKWSVDNPEWARLQTSSGSIRFAGAQRECEFTLTGDNASRLFVLRKGETQFEGRATRQGFDEDATLSLAIDLSGKTKVKTFKTEGTPVTVLKYRGATDSGPDAQIARPEDY